MNKAVGWKKRKPDEVEFDIATQTKNCFGCKDRKDFKDFSKDSGSLDGRFSTCKECQSIRSKEMTPEYRRSKQLKMLYGITQEHYESLLERQGFRCAICGAKEAGGPTSSFKIDHCHDSGHVRGLLCNKCNLGIGHLQDDIAILHKAIEYLNENRTGHRDIYGSQNDLDGEDDQH